MLEAHDIKSALFIIDQLWVDCLLGGLAVHVKFPQSAAANEGVCDVFPVLFGCW